MRSVFVGNIPYEATEEQLKDIFSEVGPVVSFRLVYDRETGKPKGYGFCEYKDQEMALSAMRNLNGFELNGRALRVDNAASEKSKEELKNLQASLGGPPVESPYGSETAPEKAPEEISKAVASLPPEQMFELMKQMKMCIENNPNEARNLLLQNPQLAYALLQAQVIMRIVDPQVAMGLLHRPSGVNVTGILSSPESKMETSAPVVNPFPPVDIQPGFPAAPVPSAMNPGSSPIRPSLLGDRPPAIDPRAIADRDMRQAADHDMRPPPMLSIDKDMRQAMADQDLRQDSRRFVDPRFRAENRFDRSTFDPRTAYEGRPARMEDPRGAPIPPSRMPLNPRMAASPVIAAASPNAVPSPRPSAALAAAAAAIAPHDQEKAALIMQVLQLSDQQIAMLPPEQRQSIMVLKEQIARSQQV